MHGAHPDRPPSTPLERTGDTPDEPHDPPETPSDKQDALSLVDDLIKEGARDKELGQDPSVGHARQGSSNDLGARAHLPEAPRGVTPQQKDFVGPAFAKTSGADDKERPAVGATSGRPSSNDLHGDVGGPHQLRSSAGPQAGELAPDPRVVSPIDPGKV
ncbi:MAG: hypothetical protein HYX75_16520 [Acidobacteria bacterium]|nr:hypothetical protein [Acidobacteriota bacterium]